MGAFKQKPFMARSLGSATFRSVPWANCGPQNALSA